MQLDSDNSNEPHRSISPVNFNRQL